MPDSPTTRPSLMVRIRDREDTDAWAQFIDIYAPLIYGLARKRGLQDADAADLTQDVLRVVASAAGRLDYDQERDSFRGWLFTVVRNKLHDFAAREHRNGRGTGDTSVQQIVNEQPAPEEELDFWSREYEQQVFACAAGEVRRSVEPATWQAFWQTAVEGKAGKTAAEELGMSVAAVYVAKSRVIARLRKQVQRWMEE
jgi:RNA polymerase sigma factor (sigma-70 family)